MSRSSILLAAVLALAPAAAAGAGAAAPAKPLALTAAPARLVFRGSGETAVRIRNSGTRRLAVDASLAGFALDLRGRPRIVRRLGLRSAAPWLTLRPAHLIVGAHATAHLRVAARLPQHAEPGDHDALVLIDARSPDGAPISVRLRLGVVAIVRAPGEIVRRVGLGRLRQSRRGKRALELVVVNGGNVTEGLRVRATLTRPRTRHVLATAAAGPREVRPHTRGLLELRFRPRVHGPARARVVIPGEPGRAAVRRTYRVRL